VQLIARKAIIMFPMKITHSGYLPPSKIGRLSFLQLFRDSISPRRLRRLRGCHFSIHVYIDIYYMHIYIYCVYIYIYCVCIHIHTYIYIQLIYIYVYILYVYMYMYNKYNTHLVFFKMVPQDCHSKQANGNPVEKCVPHFQTNPLCMYIIYTYTGSCKCIILCTRPSHGACNPSVRGVLTSCDMPEGPVCSRAPKVVDIL
jgi:hypothetical protein